MSLAVTEPANAANGVQSLDRASSARDMLVVACATLGSAALSIQLELSETIVAWTRPWEHVQLDEAPVVMLALSTALAWFARRRYREARRELGRREAAEAELAHLLLENRRLGQQLVRVQEYERKTLAQELHDELGQYLNAIKIEAVALSCRASRSLTSQSNWASTRRPSRTIDPSSSRSSAQRRPRSFSGPQSGWDLRLRYSVSVSVIREP